jgi:hypothetical protein
MSNRLYIVICALVGVICGFATIHSPLAHSWTSMIFWVVVGLTILYFNPNRRTAVYAGATFGFLDIASWLFSGFQGNTVQLQSFILAILVASIIGAASGALGAVLFYWLFRQK